MARAAPASAIRFYAFAAYKAKLTAATVFPAALQGAASVSLIAGGFAGMTAMMACFPLESVRTRMAQASYPNPYPRPHPHPNPHPNRTRMAQASPAAASPIAHHTCSGP